MTRVCLICGIADGDWGTLPTEDKALNEQALHDGGPHNVQLSDADLKEEKGMSSEPGKITDAQVKILRDEAGQAGDLAQARICDLALGQSGEDMARLLGRALYAEEAAAIEGMTTGAARAECQRVIAGTATQLSDELEEKA